MREHETKSKKDKPSGEHTANEIYGRPVWSGTISFGLVSIPVNLFPANRDSRVSFRSLGPDGEPLKRDYYSQETGQDLGESETVRGFEAAKGKIVTVTEEELERLAPEKSRDINLRIFVAQNNISPLYFERGYILTPADNSHKAYRLLAEIMESSRRAGIATFVMHGKEYLVGIFAVDGILRAETLRFNDEIRKPSGIGLAKRKKPSPTTVRKFQSDIARLSKTSLDLGEMRDEYSERVLKFIEKKHAKGRDVVASESPTRGPAQVVDLMEVLKRNLQHGPQA
ncbi:MAG TPA: Ku protein [Terriglobia bacterium]|nr:Ku protein [Terriglobia bacterium]